MKIDPKQKLVEGEEAKIATKVVLEQLKEKEKHKKNNQNSEIQTLGIDVNALGGLIYHQKIDTPWVKAKRWNQVKPIFQKEINEMAANGGPTKYYVFTYENYKNAEGFKSRLKYLDEMDAETAE